MDDFVSKFIFAGIIVAVVLGLSAVLSKGVDRLHEKRKLPPYLIGPLRIFLKWGIFVLAALLLLHIFGLQIGGIWALISTVLAMIAIGFVAVWSMLSNLSATLLILIFRPFEIGDQVEFVGEPTKGRIRSLGMVYTTLAESDDTDIQVPNNLFFQKILRRTRGRTKIDLHESLKQQSAQESRVDPETAGVESAG